MSAQNAVAPLCVTCAGPAAIYQCRIEHAEKVQKYIAGGKAQQLMRLACIKDIAQRHAHDRCSVGTAAAQACHGPEHLVDIKSLVAAYVEGSDRPPATAVPGGTTPTAAKAPPSLQRDPNAPPRTVVELFEKSAKSSQQQMKKAGDAITDAGKAVGGTVDQTLRCLTSFFKNC
ncbi:MAG TPA: hypothetical protein VMX97_11390 [Hyphomicrobiaceae bacterium]|nr:hypothetical protein [Hyphomicrobiaceae bacterium]